MFFFWLGCQAVILRCACLLLFMLAAEAIRRALPRRQLHSFPKMDLYPSIRAHRKLCGIGVWLTFRPPATRGGIQMLGTESRSTAWPRSVQHGCLQFGRDQFDRNAYCSPRSRGPEVLPAADTDSRVTRYEQDPRHVMNAATTAITEFQEILGAVIADDSSPEQNNMTGGRCRCSMLKMHC